jgi:hypothetical protein
MSPDAIFPHFQLVALLSSGVRRPRPNDDPFRVGILDQFAAQ